MRPSFVRAGAGLALTLAACTLDSTNPAGSGGASASSGASPTSTTSDASSSMSVGGASPTSGSMDASSSGSSLDTSSASSSSSGGPTPTVAPCFMTKDDFDGYAGLDATFVTLGEETGPWEEYSTTKADVSLVPSGRIRADYNGGSGAFLQLKTLQLLTGTCAITARLASIAGGDAALGVWDLGQGYTEIECKSNNGVCKPLRAFGFDGPDVSLVNGGLHLGIVLKGTQAFAFYSGDGANWTLLPNVPAGGANVAQIIDQSVTAYFGQNPNQQESEWDDFGVYGIPANLVP